MGFDYGARLYGIIQTVLESFTYVLTVALHHHLYTAIEEHKILIDNKSSYLSLSYACNLIPSLHLSGIRWFLGQWQMKSLFCYIHKFNVCTRTIDYLNELNAMQKPIYLSD